MRNHPEAITEIATRAFARAKDEAIRENDRRGVPSYGSKDGQIVVRQPPQARDPWLQAMLDDAYRGLGAMIAARGGGEFSADEEARFWALIREVEEIWGLFPQPRNRWRR
jgi:hypothetical protein